MQIVAVTRVLNEEDIIEPLIRHHAALVDHHIILDNGSVDRTLDILLALKAEGARLTVLQNDSVIFSETQFNTLLYDLAVDRFGADWVAYLDADEFIDTRKIANLRDFLAAVPREHATVGLQLVNYNAASVATQDEINVVKRLSRRGRLPVAAWKVFVRGGIGAGRVIVDAGNHHISVDGTHQEPMRQSHVVLAHFPNRSPLHWAAKAVTGRLKVLAAGQTELRQQRAFHYIELVEALRNDPRGWYDRALAAHRRLMTSDDLIDDPIAYLGEDLRYTRQPEYGWRALSLTLSNYEKLAKAYGSALDTNAELRESIHDGIGILRVLSDDPTLSQALSAAPRANGFRAARSPMVRRYTCATLDELMAEEDSASGGTKSVESVPWLLAASLNVPALAFGDTNLSRDDLLFYPPGEKGVAQEAGMSGLERGATSAFLLRGVLLHGQHGIMTIGDRVISDSLVNIPAKVLADADWQRSGAVTLPAAPLSATIHSGYQLLLGELRNYYHWMMDAMSRFDIAQYRAFAHRPETAGAPLLLLPTLDAFWKWESASLLVPDSVPRIALAPAANVFVQHLLYIPHLNGGMFNPHPALLDMFNAMRTAALGGAPVQPWRRLYISRADSRNRVLANEADVITRAERAGFTTVLLSKLSVPDQVRLFAEASHILAPHGAGLTNIGFCQPGAVLCELHMDSYVHWAFRRLAALRGLRYGCLIGTTAGERRETAHDNAWRLDLAALDAVLTDPRFVGG